MTATEKTRQQTVQELRDALQLTDDALDSLTVPELRLANSTLSRQNGRSVELVHAITTPTEDRWEALAYVAWLHAKRHDRQAKLQPYLELTAKELVYVTATPPPALDTSQDEDDPAQPAPTLEDLEAKARQDPTEPTP